MATFFTADTHFGHGAGRGFYKRPFASLVEMDAALEAGWNAVVGEADEVWHLGDFAVGHRAPGAVLGRLRGRKHLVAGNNDGEAVRALAGWASVGDYREIVVEGQALVLCHYAFRTWRDMAKGAIDLHGHSHGKLARQGRQVDVGVDAWAFRPASLAEIMGRLGIGRAAG